MSPVLLAALLWLLLAGCAATPPAPPAEPPAPIAHPAGTLQATLQPLADSLAARLVGRSVTGLSIGMWHHGRPVVAGEWGWADSRGGTALSSRTMFRLASVTKQFIAAAAFVHADRGELDLDGSVESVLGVSFGNGPLRIRHLLSQTSGFTRATDTALVVLATEHGSQREIVLPLLARSHGLARPAGEAWEYANTNYVLAGWMLEQATGRSLGRVFESLVHDSLGIQDLRWCPYVDGDPHLAHGHIMQDGALVRVAELPPWYEVTGGAGLACGTRDALGSWGNRLLEEPQLLERLAAPVLLNDGSTSLYRYGVIADPFFGTVRVAHSGGALGFSARIAVLPELGATVVVLANTQATSVVEAIEARLSRRLIETVR